MGRGPLCQQQGFGRSACLVGSGVPWGIIVEGYDSHHPQGVSQAHLTPLAEASVPKVPPNPFCCWHCFPAPDRLTLELGLGNSTLQWAGESLPFTEPKASSRHQEDSVIQLTGAPRTGDRLTSTYHRGMGSASALSWHNPGFPLG